MANLLSMAQVNSIHTLHNSGQSNCQLLGIDRTTVGKYVHELQNQPNAPPGDSVSPTGGPVPRTGPVSGGQAFREIILVKLDAGLSAKRIHQDLVRENSYSGSYYSVRRFVARLESKTPLPFRRIETGPGEEARVDFGTAAPVIEQAGKKRRPAAMVTWKSTKRTPPLRRNIFRVGSGFAGMLTSHRPLEDWG